MHHPFWIILLAAGSIWGVFGKRLQYAWNDHKGAVARLKAAKRERRRAVLWAAGFFVLALAVIHVLA